MEKNHRVVLTIIALAQFMVVLDVTVVNVDLPHIRRESHTDARNGRRVEDLGAPLATTGLRGGSAISTTHEAR